MSDIRLIDANALCKKSKPMYGRSIMGYIDHVAEGAVTLNEIHQAPTIDAVPVVHARWIKSNKHVWRKTATGGIDHFAVDFEYHNGPACEICGLSFCEHCHPEKFNEESCKDQYFCSACGRMEMKEEPYCHCGAKMDGGEPS